MHGFISYAHDDYRSFVELCKHLRTLERIFDLVWLTDKRVKAGDYWSLKIEEAINESEIYILLFSPSFIYSDYIIDVELPAIERRFAQGCLVLPVVLDRCAWQAFATAIQACPLDKKGSLLPILDWCPRKHGFDAAREQISFAIQEVARRRRHKRWVRS